MRKVRNFAMCFLVLVGVALWAKWATSPRATEDMAVLGEWTATARAAVDLPGHVSRWAARARAVRDLEECRQNLKNLATALEMYSTDHSGRYPGALMGHPPTGLSMMDLVPNYVRAFPTCPAAGEDTYSRTYNVWLGPDQYLFWCSGNHHDDVRPGYNSVQGLTETLEDIQWVYWGSSSKPYPPGEPPYSGKGLSHWR